MRVLLLVLATFASCPALQDSLSLPTDRLATLVSQSLREEPKGIHFLRFFLYETKFDGPVEFEHPEKAFAKCLIDYKTKLDKNPKGYGLLKDKLKQAGSKDSWRSTSDILKTVVRNNIREYAEKSGEKIPMSLYKIFYDPPKTSEYSDDEEGSFEFNLESIPIIGPILNGAIRMVDEIVNGKPTLNQPPVPLQLAPPKAQQDQYYQKPGRRFGNAKITNFAMLSGPTLNPKAEKIRNLLLQPENKEHLMDVLLEKGQGGDLSAVDEWKLVNYGDLWHVNWDQILIY